MPHTNVVNIEFLMTHNFLQIEEKSNRNSEHNTTPMLQPTLNEINVNNRKRPRLDVG
jgi:hypothetical protein